MSRKTFRFCYGDEEVSIEIEESSVIRTLALGNVPEHPDPEGEIKNALARPIDSPRVSELARGKKSVLLLIPDRTRKIPLDLILPHVLSELTIAGVVEENIRFLICSGTHRAMIDREIEEHVGTTIYTRYRDRIFNHEWWREEQLVSMGTTPNGTPIDINRYLVEADLKVAVGAVKPHRDAGWSGGAKMIQPGASGFRTTGCTHWLSSKYPVEQILGNNDNPVRREMEQIAGQVGLDFVINCVLTDRYRIARVFAGHYVHAHRMACEAARAYFEQKIDELCDIFICGSSAVQNSMWSNATGPNWSELVIKPGGTVVMFAKCSDGVCREHPDVLKYGYLPYERVRELVERGEITDLVGASHLQHGGEKMYGSKKIGCIIVSRGVTREDAKKLHIEYAETPQEAVDRAFAWHGSSSRAYLYPSYYFGQLLVKKG